MNNTIKISRGLDSLIRRKEPIEVEKLEKIEEVKEDIKVLYSAEEVHSDEKIEDSFDDNEFDEDYIDDEEDEMGLEIESLIEREKVPSFLDRMKSIKEEDKKIEKEPIPVSVKYEKITENNKPKKVSLLDKLKEEKNNDKKEMKSTSQEDVIKKEDKAPEFVEKIKDMNKKEQTSKKEEQVVEFKNEKNYTYDELLKKYETAVSINNRLMKLVDGYEALLEEKNSLIQEQKELILEYEETIKPKKSL